MFDVELFTKRLRTLMEDGEKKITCKELSEVESIGISESALRKYHSLNQNKYPSIDELINLSNYFDCDIEYLCGIQDLKRRENISIVKLLGFDENIIYNIQELLRQRKRMDEIDPERPEPYDILCNILGTEEGNDLLTMIAYRIIREGDYPNSDTVRTTDYAGVGHWIIKVEDLKESDNMDLYHTLQTWVASYSKGELTKKVKGELIVNE